MNEKNKIIIVDDEPQALASFLLTTLGKDFDYRFYCDKPYEAVDYAASLAGYVSKGDYQVISRPATLSSMEQIMMMIGGEKEAPSILADTPFEALGRSLDGIREGRPGQAYARLPYDIVIR